MVKVYAPTWFETKHHRRLEIGSLHLLHEVQRQSDCLTGDMLELVRRYTQINGFYAHEEHVLLYLISSDKPEDREVVVRLILRKENKAIQESQSNKKSRKKVRSYRPRSINWYAETVDHLIDLHKAETEPPLTVNLTDIEVNCLLDCPFIVPDYECISQYVERGVKATTEAAACVTGQDRQDGLTINKEVSRKKITSIRHKKSYCE